MPPVVARITAALLAVTLLSGCSAHRRMLIPGQPPPRPDARGVEAGDGVRITQQSGARVSFRVAEVRPDALVSSTGERIAFDSMTRLEARKFAWGRTLILAGGALALLLMTLTALATAALSDAGSL
jgi:hypothetical protein